MTFVLKTFPFGSKLAIHFTILSINHRRVINTEEKARIVAAAAALAIFHQDDLKKG